MSIHEILSKDSAWHFIHQEQNGINYVYASNIQEDEILSIIKYTMPPEIQKTMLCPIHHSRDTFYIVVGQEHEHYYLHLSLAQSEDLNKSHTEVLRITAHSVEELITAYIGVKQEKKFTVKVTNAITGGAVQLPIYLVPKEKK